MIVKEFFRILSTSRIIERSESLYGNSSFMRSHLQRSAEEMSIGFHSYLKSVDILDKTFNLGLKQQEFILDAGCGFGHLVMCLRSKGFNSVGIEVNSADLNAGRNVAQKLLPHVNPEKLLLSGNLANMSFIEFLGFLFYVKTFL